VSIGSVSGCLRGGGATSQWVVDGGRAVAGKAVAQQLTRYT